MGSETTQETVSVLMILFAWKLIHWTGHLPAWLDWQVTIWRSGEGWFPDRRSALTKEPSDV